MRNSAKLLLTALAASMLLATAVASSSATRLSISNQNVRNTFTSLEVVASEAGLSIRCQVTLEGSFHTRTIAKVERALIGAITRAQVKQEACTGGSASAFNGVERYNGTTSPNTLPWHITYKSFTGTLPNITSIRRLFGRFRFGIRDSGGFCTGQYGSAVDNIVAADTREAGGGITSIEPVAGENRITLVRMDGGLVCPTTGTLAGRGLVTLLGAATRITITLI